MKQPKFIGCICSTAMVATSFCAFSAVLLAILMHSIAITCMPTSATDNTVTPNDTDTFVEAVANASNSHVYIQGMLTLGPFRFDRALNNTTGLDNDTLYRTQNITIFSDDGLSAADNATQFLDFGNVEEVMVMGRGTSLRFENLTMKGVASRYRATRSADISVANFGLDVWPSVAVEENCTVSFIGCQTYRTSPVCDGYRSRNWSAQFVRLFGPGSSTIDGQGRVLVRGDYTVALRLWDSTDPAVAQPEDGVYYVRYKDTAIVCLLDSSITTTTDNSSAPTYWDADFVAVVSAYNPYSNEEGSSGVSIAVWIGWAVPVGLLLLLSAPCVSATRRWFWRRRLLKAKNITPFRDVRASVRSSPSSNASKGLPSSRDLSQVASMQASRMAPADGLVMGPLIGRGGFGKVYKGKWRGVLVAVKVVETFKKKEPWDDGVTQEMLVCTRAVHPNVVTAYKIWLSSNPGEAVLTAGSSAFTPSAASAMSPRPSGNLSAELASLHSPRAESARRANLSNEQDHSMQKIKVESTVRDQQPPEAVAASARDVTSGQGTAGSADVDEESEQTRWPAGAVSDGGDVERRAMDVGAVSDGGDVERRAVDVGAVSVGGDVERRAVDVGAVSDGGDVERRAMDVAQEAAGADVAACGRDFDAGGGKQQAGSAVGVVSDVQGGQHEGQDCAQDASIGTDERGVGQRSFAGSSVTGDLHSAHCRQSGGSASEADGDAGGSAAEVDVTKVECFGNDGGSDLLTPDAAVASPVRRGEAESAGRDVNVGSCAVDVGGKGGEGGEDSEAAGSTHDEVVKDGRAEPTESKGVEGGPVSAERRPVSFELSANTSSKSESTALSPTAGGSENVPQPSSFTPGLGSSICTDGGSSNMAYPELWMVMEYCDKGSVCTAIRDGVFHDKRSGVPKMDVILLTLLDVCGGMEYLHSCAFIHGDLKAANVLLSSINNSRGFVCKIGDFSMSRVLDVKHSHIATRTHGTLPYMAPELLQHGKLTQAGDVYSFGILAWEMYSGLEAFKGCAAGDIIQRIVVHRERPRIPQGCPDFMEKLLQRCWNDDPAERPTFSEVRSCFQEQLRRLRVRR